MAETSKERYRVVRGLMLKFLTKEHPGPLYVDEILLLLDDLGFAITKEELFSHISYLEEGKLIRVEKRTYGAVEFVKIFVTRDGLNVHNGFAKDVGIDVRF